MCELYTIILYYRYEIKFLQIGTLTCVLEFHFEGSSSNGHSYIRILTYRFKNSCQSYVRYFIYGIQPLFALSLDYH